MVLTASGFSGFPTVSMQPGNSGGNVTALQQWLVKNGLLTQAQMNTGVGIYGPATTAAVASLQAQLGVNAGASSGYYGPLTIAAIQADLATLTTPSHPDLVINSLSLTSTSVLPGATNTVSFSIGDPGNAASAATTATVSLYTGGGALVQQFGAVPIGAITANGGASGAKSLGVTLPTTLAPGSYSIGVTVAPVAGEIATSNNTLFTPLTILAPSHPDLVINSLSLTSTSVSPGATNTVNFSIGDHGNAASAATTATVGLYTSGGALVQQFGNVPIGAITANGGASGAKSLGVTLPTTLAPGNYNIGVTVAPVASEIATSNNTLFTPLTITGTLAGEAVLNDAIKHLGEAWGNYNCPGFVYTVSYEANAHDGLFDPSGSEKSWVGARGSNNAGPLLNMTTLGIPANPNFIVPIGNAGNGAILGGTSNGIPFYLNADVPGDGWHLVGDSKNNNATTINPNDPNSLPELGDLFRGLVVGADNKTTFLHSGVVSSYDPKTNSIWLISNWVSNSAGPGAALISNNQFFLGASGASRDIVGPITLYRIGN
jgi:hypothetical protein